MVGIADEVEFSRKFTAEIIDIEILAKIGSHSIQFEIGQHERQVIFAALHAIEQFHVEAAAIVELQVDAEVGFLGAEIDAGNFDSQLFEVETAADGGISVDGIAACQTDVAQIDHPCALFIIIVVVIFIKLADVGEIETTRILHDDHQRFLQGYLIELHRLA